MRQAPIPENDVERLRSLAQMLLVSTPREADLDRITRTAHKFFDAEIALISLVDEKRQWFKSRVGLNASETPRDISFCGHAINGREAFVVADASVDTRFADNPLVADGLKVRFYAGQPITNSDGFVIGTLCVISSKPKELTADQIGTLEDLGRLVEVVLENRQLNSAQFEVLQQLDISARDSLIDTLTGLWNRKGFDAISTKELSNCRVHGRSIAFVLLKAGNFGDVIGRHGQHVGDAVMKKISDIIVHNTRSTDSIFRIGIDEFLVICPNIEGEAAARIGNNLIAAINGEGSVISGTARIDIAASAGVTAGIPVNSNAEAQCSSLLTQANSALRQSIRSGGGCCTSYENTEKRYSS
jgi:diguanylate cyclase (GGDEF)-like protein